MKDLEVLSNEVVADVEELELLCEHVDGDRGRPAQSPATLIEVEDRVETRTVAVEEILVALAVVETDAATIQSNDYDNENNIARSNSGPGRIATPSGGEWTRPPRALGAQRLPQTSASTQPPVRYIHTAAPNSTNGNR